MPEVGQPPAAAPALSELTDVDASAGDGLANLARLTYDDELAKWLPVVPTPFDVQQGTTPADEWQEILVGTGGAVASGGGNPAYAHGKLWYIGGASGNRLCSVAAGSQQPDWTEGTTHPTGSGASSMTAGFVADGDGSTLWAWFYKSQTDFDFVRVTDEDTWVPLSVPVNDPGTINHTGSPGALAFVNGRIHRVGTSQFSVDQHHAYDPVTDTWDDLGAPPADGPLLFAAGGKLYAVGSSSFDDRSVYVYADGAWSQLADAPATLDTPSQCAATALGPLVYLFGGVPNGRTDTPIHVYSPALDQWDEIATTAPADALPPDVNPEVAGTSGGRLLTIATDGVSSSKFLYVYG